MKDTLIAAVTSAQEDLDASLGAPDDAEAFKFISRARDLLTVVIARLELDAVKAGELEATIATATKAASDERAAKAKAASATTSSDEEKS